MILAYIYLFINIFVLFCICISSPLQAFLSELNVMKKDRRVAEAECLHSMMHLPLWAVALALRASPRRT